MPFFCFFFFLQASGVSVSEEVKLRFDEIKKKKTFRYVVFFIKDEKAIAVETTGRVGGQFFPYLGKQKIWK